LSMARERRTIPLMGEHSAAARDCPLAPPEHSSVYSRALHRACLIVGGVEILGDRLSVDVEKLKHWMKGDEVPPETVFLACVEMILLYASGMGRPS
jgi:hypothetical protein